MGLGRVVAVAKEEHIHNLARQLGREVYAAESFAEAIDIIAGVNPDLILLDSRTNPHVTARFLEEVNRQSNAPVVLLNGTEDCASQMAKLVQARHDATLIGSLRSNPSSGIEPGEIGNSCSPIGAAEFFAQDFAAAVCMAGQSPAIAKALRMIKIVAASTCNPVLVVGETGTGKELAAKAIHVLRHPDEPFVAVNCAALTASLLESELFGHVKGAFTGAERDKTGLLEVAGAGTVLLDEITETPLDLQAKLLRVLQEKTFRRVGGVKDIDCKATIVATSNRNLQKEVQANRFRRDLYYRLNVIPITIATLASPERKDDIRLLAEYFLKTSTICPEKRNKITSLTSLAIETLQNYDWPGNVRELRNVIERAIILETTDKIGLSSIIIDCSQCTEGSDSSRAGTIKSFSLAQAERELIARALRETGWQKTRAASLLGITRATLYAKVKQYNIEKVPGVAGAEQSDVDGPAEGEAVAANQTA